MVFPMHRMYRAGFDRHRKGGDIMHHQWFFGCRQRCGCRSCCHQGCNSSGVYAVTYYRHFANVPMRIFYGPGFTAEDSLESIDTSLETIAEQFANRQTASRRNCCC